MKIDDTTPEKIMKDLESAKQKEKDNKQTVGIIVSIVLVSAILASFLFYPGATKAYAIATYDAINHVIHVVKAKF